MTIFLNWLGYLETVICVVALCFIVAGKQGREYWALASFLGVRAVCSSSLGFVIHQASKMDRVHKLVYFKIYLVLYWGAFAIESVLALIVLYSIIRNTMAPLKGLRSVATAVFCVGLFLSFLAGLMLAQGTGARRMVASLSQLQRMQSVVSLCLVVFVCLAVRSVGLSYRSKVFGVSLGLGLLAISVLAQYAWLTLTRAHTLADLANGVVLCATLTLWAVYFAMREPERRGVAPDSFLFRWNARTLALLR